MTGPLPFTMVGDMVLPAAAADALDHGPGPGIDGEVQITDFFTRDAAAGPADDGSDPFADTSSLRFLAGTAVDPDTGLPTSWLRREQTALPSPDMHPDEVLQEFTHFSPADGHTVFALPGYEFPFLVQSSPEGGDPPELQSEPAITITAPDGTDVLTVTLWEHFTAAEFSGAERLPHALAVTLTFRVPVAGGGGIRQRVPFPSVVRGADTELGIPTFEASMPLPPPLRRQVLAAFGSPAADAQLVVGRGIRIAWMVGFFPDGQPAYEERSLLREFVPRPVPLVLTAEKLARLGAGGIGGMAPVQRFRVPFGDRSYSYWHDPGRPERYYYVPDRFLLARDDVTHRPLLRVRAAGAATEADNRPVLEFRARPTLEPARLEAARPALAEEAARLGSTDPVRLEIFPDQQPLLLLALPVAGAASAQLTERPDTDIDLQLGLRHAETFDLADFRVVYEALFGASLTLLSGEVRVGADSDAPEDVPIELRLDRTAGPVLSLTVDGPRPDGTLAARLQNLIESSIRVDSAVVTGLADGQRVALTSPGLVPGLRFPPGAVDPGIVLVPPPGVDASAIVTVELDPEGLTVEPAADVIWQTVFDATAGAALTRSVTVQAVEAQFDGPERPDDEVIAFVVAVERGDTAQVTRASLTATATVRVPIVPLLTGDPVPPIRYRTETLWRSGGIGTSAVRETEATILIPIRTAP